MLLIAQKKFIKRLKQAQKKIKSIQPRRAVREFESICHITSFASLSFYKTERNKASKIATDVISQCFPALLLNMAMGSASDYRKSVRFVQRAWKSKFLTRTEVLCSYAERHLESVIKEFPHLIPAYKVYK